MAEQVQSPQERERLHAAWLADPRVVAFTAATARFVSESGLGGRFDAESLTLVVQFGCRWTAENGDLPDSGILCP